MYKVKTTWLIGGYRCLCCVNPIEYEKEFSSLDEALKEFPLVPTIREVVLDSLKQIEIWEGDNLLGTGTLSYPQIRGDKYAVYSYSKWEGEHPVEGPFCVIIKGERGKEITDKTWEKIIQEENQKANLKRKDQ